MKLNLGLRLFFAGVLTLAITGATRAGDAPIDQPEPPVRLKEKEKPRTKQSDDADKQPKQLRRRDEPRDEDPAAGAPEEDPKEIVGRVARNMRSSEEHLARKDPGEGTRQIQGDIIKDLDELIKQKRCQCQQQQSSSSSSSSSSQSRRSSQGKNGKGQQGGRKEQTAGASSPSPGGKSGGKGKDGSGVGQTAKREKGGNTADLYKDVWGHLPENLRQQMDAYSKEKFMARYGDLLKQYYATLAEKSRKKE